MTIRKAIDVRISNVGGISTAALTLSPGVNVLTGANGAGKTSALRAVSRAFGSDVALEVRDGASQGTVEADGVRLVVKRVVRSTGAAELKLADGSALADLIDPGLKDSEAAAKARVRALLQLVRVPVTEDVLGVLADDPEVVAAVRQEHAEGSIEDLLAAQERIRQHTHRLAREAEALADVTRGRLQASEQRLAQALEKIGGEDGLIDLGAQAAEAAVHEAVRHLEVARVGAAKRAELEHRQEELRATLGEVVDPSVFDHGIQAQRDAMAAHQRRIEELEHELASEREMLAGIVVDLKHLVAQQADAVARVEQQREARRILALPVDGPTQNDVDALEQTVEHCRAQFAAARLSDEVRQTKAAVAAERQAVGAATARAEQLRASAASIANRLGGILAGTDASGLTVSDGRLAELVDGVPMDFERRRSEGQRIRAALRVAAKAYRGKVVPLDGRYWLALDEANRREFAAAAAELGLYVITEQPTGGPLQVQHVDEVADQTAGGAL